MLSVPSFKSSFFVLFFVLVLSQSTSGHHIFIIVIDEIYIEDDSQNLIHIGIDNFRAVNVTATLRNSGGNGSIELGGWEILSYNTTHFSYISILRNGTRWTLFETYNNTIHEELAWTGNNGEFSPITESNDDIEIWEGFMILSIEYQQEDQSTPINSTITETTTITMTTTNYSESKITETVISTVNNVSVNSQIQLLSLLTSVVLIGSIRKSK